MGEGVRENQLGGAVAIRVWGGDTKKEGDRKWPQCQHAGCDRMYPQQRLGPENRAVVKF